MVSRSIKNTAVRARTLLAIACAIAIVAAAHACEAGTVTFVNLSRDDVFVAKQVYVGGHSGSADAGPGESGLSYYTPPHFEHTGWWTIGPGRSYEGTSNALYYLEKRGREVTWSGLETSLGVVRASEFRGVELYPNSGVPKQLIDKGYRRATFRRFNDNGVYRISGDAYRIAAPRTFQINIQSRSFRSVTETFRVPGRVAYFTYDLDTKWADVSWSKRDDYVYLGGAMEGKQVRLGGPREHAYVRGHVKVYYTVPAG